jgi:DNA transformation protein
MNDPGFVAHCLELLAPVGAPRARRMFGGHGLYIDDLFVAIVSQDALYLKSDDTSGPLFREAGGRPFTYDTRDGELHETHFWTVPEEAMESPREMIPWARRAIAAAVAARGAKKPAAKAKAPPKSASAAKPSRAAPAKKQPAARKAPR